MTTLANFQLTDLVDDHKAADVNVLRGGVLRAEYVNTETITATKELADSDCQFQVITPSGADRTVELAPPGVSNHVTIIYNAGATYNILVKDSTGVTTYATLAPGKWDVFLPIYGNGWASLSLEYVSNYNWTQTNENGWVQVIETWTRTGDYTFTVSGDVTSKYRKGTKVRFKQGGGYKYGIIKSSSYSSPNTTVTLISNTDYLMTAGAVTDTYLSYISTPSGFPSEFNFSAALTNVTIGNGTLVQKFSVAGNLFLYHVEFSFGSTSAISGDVSFNPPVTPLSYDVNVRNVVGLAILFDASGSTGYQGIVLLDAVGNLAIRYAHVSGTYVINGTVTSSVPFTWADGDKLTMNGCFKW